MKIENFLFKERLPLMNKALDTYSLRMTTAAKNISNANTVGYKPNKVEFEKLFQDQMAITGTKTNEKHISMGYNPNPSGELMNRKIPISEAVISGENDINIDKEMAEVAQNQVRFQFVSQSMSKYFKQLNAAITGNTNY